MTPGQGKKARPFLFARAPGRLAVPMATHNAGKLTLVSSEFVRWVLGEAVASFPRGRMFGAVAARQDRSGASL